MALHDAVLDLQRGRVDYAVVGGSSAIFRPATSLAFLRLKWVSFPFLLLTHVNCTVFEVVQALRWDVLCSTGGILWVMLQCNNDQGPDAEHSLVLHGTNVHAWSLPAVVCLLTVRPAWTAPRCSAPHVISLICPAQDAVPRRRVQVL